MWGGGRERGRGTYLRNSDAEEAKRSAIVINGLLLHYRAAEEMYVVLLGNLAAVRVYALSVDY